MKKQEIKKLSKDEIMKNIDKLKKDLFNFRFQKINSQITNPKKERKENKQTIVTKNALTSEHSLESVSDALIAPHNQSYTKI